MASLKAAIKAKCKDCTYDPQAPGTYLQQIEDCTVRSCPLWAVRPMTVATINANRNKRGNNLNLDALVDGLPDDDEEEVTA